MANVYRVEGRRIRFACGIQMQKIEYSSAANSRRRARAQHFYCVGSGKLNQPKSRHQRLFNQPSGNRGSHSNSKTAPCKRCERLCQGVRPHNGIFFPQQLKAGFMTSFVLNERRDEYRRVEVECHRRKPRSSCASRSAATAAAASTFFPVRLRTTMPALRPSTSAPAFSTGVSSIRPATTSTRRLVLLVRFRRSRRAFGKTNRPFSSIFMVALMVTILPFMLP